MCGRYYIDEESNEELLKIVRNLDKRLHSASKDAVSSIHVKAGEVFPSELAPVISNRSGTPSYEAMLWGFENPHNRSLIINARCESVHEKPMFSKSLHETRIVIPASGFFEWSHDTTKQKYYFTPEDSSTLYMAGIQKNDYPFSRFVILTTTANHSMEAIHNRMPVLLQRDEVKAYLSFIEYAQEVLTRIPAPLKRTKDSSEEATEKAYKQLILPL